MLAKHLRRRLELLFFFLKKQETSIKEISSVLNISQRTVKEDIIKLNIAFKDHLNLPHFIHSQTSGNIQINPDYKESAVNHAYKLKLLLLKQVSSFNLLILLATQVSISKSEILQQLFITEAYLQKLTQQLNLYLQTYRIQIVQNKGHYALEGDEQLIRVFSYILIHDSYQSLEWPFKKITLDSIQAEISPMLFKLFPTFSQSKKRQLSILYAIFMVRCQANQFSSLPKDPNITKIMQLLKENYDASALVQMEKIQVPSEAIKQNEQLFFNLFARLFLSDTITKEQKIVVATRFYHENHPFCQTARSIFDYVVGEQTLSEETKYLYVYFIVLVHTWYQYMGDTFTAFIDLFLPSSQFLVQQSAPDIEKLTGIIGPLLNNPKETLYMSQLIYSLLLSNASPKLNIYLQLTKNYTAIFLVKNRLSALFNEQNIVITQNYAEADFIITDTFEPSNEQKTFFYLDAIRNTDRWNELTAAIQQKYMAKLQEAQAYLLLTE